MAAKMKKFETVDEYIDYFTGPAKEALTAIRQTVRKAAPEAQERISYNMPAYKLNGFLISFAAWKKHIGMYPRSRSMDANIPEIAHYAAEKDTMQFPLEHPMPLDLIRRIVQHRVRELKKPDPKKDKK